jgi:glutamate-1-semialdehyde 2,1-aminomutase
MDEDSNEYIDYVGSWGPLILGHADPQVVGAVKRAVDNGTSFGAPTKIETELAEMIVETFPNVDLVRFVNSGTEASMTALRLARAFTGRDKFIKFEGGYHGHADSLLVAAGSGAATHGIPTSAGVTDSFANNTLVATYNDLLSVEAFFETYSGQIACIIVEPVAGNMGVILPKHGFLEGLRELTEKNGALLIFDEVITGYRVAFGGAQQIYGVVPDITCLGKIIGGGLPVGAYCGRRDIMEKISPLGPMYQAGTLSGNPVAMAAGLATLQQLKRQGFYEGLDVTSGQLARGIQGVFEESGIPLKINRVGSMMTLFFSEREVNDYDSALGSDKGGFARFFHNMLEEGVYLPPSPLEAMFVSAAHSQEDIVRTVNAVRSALK